MAEALQVVQARGGGAEDELGVGLGVDAGDDVPQAGCPLGRCQPLAYQAGLLAPGIMAP